MRLDDFARGEIDISSYAQASRLSLLFSTILFYFILLLFLKWKRWFFALHE